MACAGLPQAAAGSGGAAGSYRCGVGGGGLLDLSPTPPMTTSSHDSYDPSILSRTSDPAGRPLTAGGLLVSPLAMVVGRAGSDHRALALGLRERRSHRAASSFWAFRHPFLNLRGE